MQKYNIIEVLNASVGAKFKDKDGQVWEIQAGINNNYLLNAEEEVMMLNSYTINLEFERVQEPLTFMEILEKILENSNQKIRVEHRFINNHSIIMGWEHVQKCTLFELIHILKINSICNDELADIFLNGKWYAEED